MSESNAKQHFQKSSSKIHLQPTSSSSMVNPRPARTRLLYLVDGHRIIGLSLSTGRGAIAAALVRRAFLLRSLRPGCISFISYRSVVMDWWANSTWSKCVRTRVCHCFRKWLLGICCKDRTLLVSKYPSESSIINALSLFALDHLIFPDFGAAAVLLYCPYPFNSSLFQRQDRK